MGSDPYSVAELTAAQRVVALVAASRSDDPEMLDNATRDLLIPLRREDLRALVMGAVDLIEALLDYMDREDIDSNDLLQEVAVYVADHLVAAFPTEDPT